MVDKQEKKEKIILAAMSLFAKKGLAGTSMADIAKGAGIGKGTTYEYFKGKDELFFATFEWFIDYCAGAARVSLSTLGSKNASDKIRAYSQSMLDLLKESKDFYPLTLEFWAASALSKDRDKIKQLFNNLYKEAGYVLVSIIEQGVESGEFDPEVKINSIVAAIIGAWDAIGLQAWFYEGINNEFDMEKTMIDFTELIIKGLLK